MAKKPSYKELEKRIQALEQADSKRKQTSEALEKRMETLPDPPLKNCI